MWNTGISDHWLPAGSYGGIYGCYSTALRSRKHEGDEEVGGIRCGTYRDRNRYSYIAEHDQYGEGAASDEIHRQTCMEKLTDILWSFAAGLWHRHFTIILQVY